MVNILKPTAEAIQNFDEKATVMNIQNNHDNTSTFNNNRPNYCCSINPVEKWFDAMEKNKRLYERLLQSEKEKAAMLRKMLNDNK